jgi:mRNA deadenylase 3'-5' endonuclease subunit Ccr4
MGSKKSHESFSIFDIVEVQAEHYTEWYVPQLKKAGYEGVFLQKSKVFFTSKYFHYTMYTYNLNLTKVVHIACPCCEYFQWNELVVLISNKFIHPYARYTVEGCATFYRSDRFHLVEKHPVEYNFQHNVCN